MAESLASLAADWIEHGPIVVLGRGHSGTRFLAEALHRQGVFVGTNLNPMFDSRTWEPLINEAILDLYPGFDGLSSHDAWVRKVLDTAERFLGEGYTGGPWGWKIGITAFIIPLLAKVFPRLRVIHLIRDGRDVMLSRLARVARLPDSAMNRKIILGDADAGRWWGRRLNWLTVYRYRNEFEMQAWVQFVDTARRYGTALGPQRYFELRYEHLCRDPVVAAAEAFQFAGLQLKPNVADFLRANARVDRIGKWAAVPARKIAPAISIGKRLLEELGYIAHRSSAAENPTDPGMHSTQSSPVTTPHERRQDHAPMAAA